MQVFYYIFLIAAAFLLCHLTGSLIKNIANNALKTPCSMLGFLFFIVSFAVLSIPFMLLKTSFNSLCFVYIAVIALSLAIMAFVLHKKNKGIQIKISIDFQSIKSFVKNHWLMIIPLCLIVFECYMYFFYGHSDADDSWYVAVSTTVLKNNEIYTVEPSSGNSLFSFNSIYSLVSYELFVAFLSKFSSINAAALCHAVIPVFLLILHYYVYYQICRELSRRNHQLIFLLLVLLDLFAGISVHTPGTYMLFRLGQGKASIPSIILPWMLYEYIKVFKTGICKENIIVFSALFYYGFHVSTVGLFLIPLSYFSLTVAYFVKDRNLRNFLRLCIPVCLATPYVIIRFLTMLGNGSSTNVISQFSAEASTSQLDYKALLKDVFGSKKMFALWGGSVLSILLLANRREDRYKRVLFCITPCIIFITYLNPFLSSLVAGHITGNAVYWRLFWTISYYATIICAFDLILAQAPKIKYFSMAFLIFIIIFCGKWLYTSDNFFKSENFEDLNASSISIVNTVVTDEEDAFLLIPEYYRFEIRQYRADIKLVISRYQSFSLDNTVNQQIEKITDDLYVSKTFSESEADFLIHQDIHYVAVYHDTTIENSIQYEELYSDTNLILIKLL